MQKKLRRFLSILRNFGLKSALKETLKYFINKIYFYLSPGASSKHLGTTEATYVDKISSSLRGFSRQWFYLSTKHNIFFSNESIHSNNVLIIADLNISQCTLYRVDGLMDFLSSYGVNSKKTYFLDYERIRKNLNAASTVIFYRVPMRDELLEIIYECRRANIKMIFDIDDPVFSFPIYSNYENLRYVSTEDSKNILEGCPKYFAMVDMCDFIITSTPDLQKIAKTYFPKKDILLRRNYISKKRIASNLNTKTTNDDKKLISICSGSIGHEDDFMLIKEVLENLLEKDKNLELILLGKFKKETLGQAINKRIKEHIPFQNYDDYINCLSETDLSIIPIQKSEFNECKSVVRLLDCFNAGVPTIVSDIGDFRNTHAVAPYFSIVKDDEWFDSINKLLYSDELCEYYRKNSKEFLSSISSGKDNYISDKSLIEKIL